METAQTKENTETWKHETDETEKCKRMKDMEK